MCIYCGTRYYRKIYENHAGPIPKDNDGRSFEIHHIDGNHSNNDPTNLKCVSIQEHYDIHYSQEDWMACHKMAKSMKLSPEEISTLGSMAQQARVRAGTHHFLGGEIQRRTNAKRISEGTHQLLGSKVNKDRVKAGTNPFAGEKGSKLSRRTQQNRVKAGTHHFLDKEAASRRQTKRIADGTHNFCGDKSPSKISSANGSHHFFGGKIQLDRVKNGTHHFLGGEQARKNNYQMLENGTHPSQKEWKCQYCGKKGKGSTNYLRWHGNKCNTRNIDK